MVTQLPTIFDLIFFWKVGKGLEKLAFLGRCFVGRKHTYNEKDEKNLGLQHNIAHTLRTKYL